MQLFKFFNKSKSEKPTETVVFWEDDYRQIELISSGNLGFIKQQLIELEKFSDKHSTESGYTALFARKENPVTTISLEIREDYFLSELIAAQMSPINIIRYEGNNTISTKSSRTKAFGISYFTLFFETKEEFVANIWLTYKQKTHREDLKKITSLLYNLGESVDLILVDWEASSVVDLKDQRQISNYLNG